MKNQLIKIILGISAIPAFAYSMEKPLDIDLFVGAVRLNDIELLKRFIDKGVNLDAIDSLGDTALTAAAENNNTAAAKVLLRGGASIDICRTMNMTTETALHVASYKGNSEMVKILLAADANPNILDSDGNTPLTNAVRFRMGPHHHNPAIIEMLLDHGADPSIGNKDSALKWAEVLFKPDILALLQLDRKKKLE